MSQVDHVFAPTRNEYYCSALPSNIHCIGMLSVGDSPHHHPVKRFCQSCSSWLQCDNSLQGCVIDVERVL